MKKWNSVKKFVDMLQFIELHIIDSKSEMIVFENSYGHFIEYNFRDQSCYVSSSFENEPSLLMLGNPFILRNLIAKEVGKRFKLNIKSVS